MDVSYNISEDDYVKAAILFGRPELKSVIAVIAIVVIAVGVAYLFGPHVGNSAVAGCLGGVFDDKTFRWIGKANNDAS